MNQVSLSLLALAGVSAGSSAEAQVAFKKNVEVLSRIPLSALSGEKKAGWRVYSGVVASRKGAVDVNGRTDWIERGIPVLTPWRLESIGKPGPEGVLVKLRNREHHRALYLTLASDPERTFALVSAPPGDSTAVRDSALRAIESAAYMEEVERHAPGQRVRLLSLAADLSRGDDGGSEADSLLAIRSYKGREYLRLDLGMGAVQSGQTPPSQGQVVTAAVNGRVLGAAKALAAALEPGATLDGLRLDLRLPPQRVAGRSGQPEEGRLEIYFPLGPLRGFVDDELTSQQLIDSSVVLLDRNRIQVELGR